LNPFCKHIGIKIQSQQFSVKVLKRILTFSLALLLVLLFPVVLFSQNNEESSETEKKKVAFDEWKEIGRLRGKFNKNKYGSIYVMGLFDGRFIGPNEKDNYGIRSFTTAYDYLIFGNSLLSMLINMGYTAEKINFISSKAVKDYSPYKLGCIMHYSITGEKYRIDSVYNRAIGKKVPIDKPFTSSMPRLIIDSAHVEAELAGFYVKRKENRKNVYDTILLPHLEGTGSWKDANNFDLVYEWFETFFQQYSYRIDINKRQFSEKTPPQIRLAIIQRFNTKKYLEQTQMSEEQLIRITDLYTNSIFDLLSLPNGQVVRMGKFELFRYFNDVYWRDVNERIVMKGKALNELGQQISYTNIWNPGDGKNPVWHCAFQYDKDNEKNPASELVNFVMLPYGTKGRSMPTVIPNDLPYFSQFEGVVIWKEGVSKQGYSNKDDIWINTLNGRMINRSFYCYYYEPGLLPLNDDGTVDGIYKIYVWKDTKEYWAYIFCGKHAAVRGGKPGKSFVDQVESFKKNYNFSDYWYFSRELDFHKDVVNNYAAFLKNLESLEKNEMGIVGKTLLKIHIPIVTENEKNPKKSKTDSHYLLLNTKNRGVLYPEKINFAWRFETTDDYQDNILVKIKSVIIIIGGDDIPILDFEDFLKSTKYTASEIRQANKSYKYYLEDNIVEDTTVNLNIVFNNSIYNLGNSDETSKLIQMIREDLATVRYQIPKVEHNLEEWQDKNYDKINELKYTIKKLENSKKTKKDIYKKTKKEYEKYKLAEDKKIFQFEKLVAKEEMLSELLKTCNERLETNLDNDLKIIISRISFLEGEKKKYEIQLNQLKVEKKTGTEHYLQVQTSINNKKEELSEAQDKKEYIKRLIQGHKRAQAEDR